MKIILLIYKSIARHPVRSSLMAMGIIVLVFVVTLVWSVLSFLDDATTEKAQNLKIIVTERWQVPSQMPLSYVPALLRGAARTPADEWPIDGMAWQFFVGTIDPKEMSREYFVFAVATDPRKIRTMMEELDSLEPGPAAELDQAIARLLTTRSGIIMGAERLRAINRKVGDRITVYGIMHKGIDLELEIVGTFPPGRYDNTSVINADYLNESIDAYGLKPGNPKHPLDQKRVNLVWLKVRDRAAFERIAQQIESSPGFTTPAVKCETAASLVSASLEAFRDLIWGVRWLLVPAAMVTLSLIIANAISISVRERRMEMAVLKVLGFRPYHILLLILGEAILLGTGAGLISSWTTYFIVDLLGGVKFPIVFFPSFRIPVEALWWGPAMGAVTALAGSILPAWSARNVSVAEVFSKVA